MSKNHIPLSGEQDWIRDWLNKLEKEIKELKAEIKKIQKKK